MESFHYDCTLLFVSLVPCVCLVMEPSFWIRTLLWRRIYLPYGRYVFAPLVTRMDGGQGTGEERVSKHSERVPRVGWGVEMNLICMRNHVPQKGGERHISIGRCRGDRFPGPMSQECKMIDPQGHKGSFG